MPVRGIGSKFADDLTFTWFGIRTYYALVTILCFGITSGYLVAYVTNVSFDFDSVETLVFYLSIFLISFSFLQLARKWPKIAQEWQLVEAKLPPLKFPKESKSLAQQIKIITFVATTCSLVEHIMSMLSMGYYVNDCPRFPGHPIDSFLYLNFSSVFYFMDYTHFLGLLGKVVNVLSTFAWNFNDIFVMAVSVALAARFRQLNDYMMREARLPTSVDHWMQCRINFRNLCKLCEEVDDAISLITLLCFSNNLYFICGKILKSMQAKPSIMHTLYFWFSLAYLLGRTLILLLYSSSINDESKRPLVIFRLVPREYWCDELKRFSEEVQMDNVALTGMKFFRLTRGVVISVAGTIVTYELILLQFNGAKKVAGCFENKCKTTGVFNGHWASSLCASSVGRANPLEQFAFGSGISRSQDEIPAQDGAQIATVENEGQETGFGSREIYFDLLLFCLSARKKALQESCETYKNHMENEFEVPSKLPKLSRSTKEAFLSDGTFHQAVGRVLLVAQFFAMMPVKGVTGKHPSNLSFSWRSIRTCFSLLFIASSLANFGLSLFKVLNNPISFNSVKPIIFRGSVLVVLMVALNLARQWPQLMMYWHTVEQDLPQYKTQLARWKMGHTISMVMLVGMMLSFAEHILSMVSAINYASFCNRTADPIQNYFLRTNDEIFFVASYSTPLAIWGKFQNVYSTFIWNYMDIFVMIVSIGLASKFQQLNDDLRNFKGMNMLPTYWSERRIQYRNICILCDKMDNAISLITMVSFSNNLYFICVQLLRSLNTMPSVAHAVYFYFSLIFLIGRTLAVSLYSSNVHDESRLTLRYLRCVPKESWCPEVKRFSEEVISDEVALSGMKFFHLTRKLVLSVAGTIVTYELVLIQFHEDNDLWDCNQSYYS
ncbi:uncharacterized protein LOC108146358 [Drosophila elegans]|uniref:uncharacterized protein LOC108146358 n=1 Tax=Drosophila elegans TaxID=30023 RepID=UPI001BC84603|nr:uncharacterized protein LOC108146358 [Drosophila elegans]